MAIFTLKRKVDCSIVRLQQPLLRLEVADAMCTCMDFMTGSKLAVGLSNGELSKANTVVSADRTGHAVVWDIVEALRSPSSEEGEPFIRNQFTPY